MRTHRKHSRLVAALVAAMLGVAAAPSIADDQPPAKDTIFARKILMDAISTNMDELETMLAPDAKLDLSEGREHAENISTLLMAFPHLFPPATNQWKQGAERDPATDTFANPAIWSNFDEFYKRATEASKIAWSAAGAKKPEDFKVRIKELRQRCDACHALNLKPD